MIEENVKETKQTAYLALCLHLLHAGGELKGSWAAVWMNARLGVIHLQEASAPFVTSEGSDFKGFSCRTEHSIRMSSASRSSLRGERM